MKVKSILCFSILSSLLCFSNMSCIQASTIKFCSIYDDKYVNLEKIYENWVNSLYKKKIGVTKQYEYKNYDTNKINDYLDDYNGFLLTLLKDYNEFSNTTNYIKLFKDITVYFLVNFDEYAVLEKGIPIQDDNSIELDKHALETWEAFISDMKNNVGQNCAFATIKLNNQNKEVLKTINYPLCGKNKDPRNKRIEANQKLVSKIMQSNTNYKLRNLCILLNSMAALHQEKDIQTHVQDSEISLLINIFNDIQKTSDVKENEKIDNVVINLYTYYDMCPICWTIWHYGISILQEILAQKFKNNLLKLHVNVYYIDEYNTNILKSKHEINVIPYLYSILNYNDLCGYMSYTIQKAIQQKVTSSEEQKLVSMKRFNSLVWKKEIHDDIKTTIETLHKQITKFMKSINTKEKEYKQYLNNLNEFAKKLIKLNNYMRADNSLKHLTYSLTDKDYVYRTYINKSYINENDVQFIRTALKTINNSDKLLAKDNIINFSAENEYYMISIYKMKLLQFIKQIKNFIDTTTSGKTISKTAKNLKELMEPNMDGVIRNIDAKYKQKLQQIIEIFEKYIKK